MKTKKESKSYEMLLSQEQEYDVMALEAKLAGKQECSGCHEVLSINSFSKNSKVASGFSKTCKTCDQDSKMRSRYGLSMDEKYRMYAKQNARCRCCDRHLEFDGKQTHIDHSHVSGKVRGLLCVDCNTSLGKLGDNAVDLAKVVKYLLESEPENLKAVMQVLVN